MVKSRHSGSPNEDQKEMATQAIKDVVRQTERVSTSKGITVNATGSQKVEDKKEEKYETTPNDDKSIGTKYCGKCPEFAEGDERDSESGFASRLLPQHENNKNGWISEREEEKEENEVDSDLESTATSRYNPS